MKAAIVFVLVGFTISVNLSFKLDSMLRGTDISLGSYYSSVSIGNLTKKYLELEPADLKATMNAVELLELLRRMFAVGIFNLPPLDPFTSNNLEPLTLGPNSFITGKISLKSLKLTGAKHFELKLAELRMKTGRVDFEIAIPELSFDVDFQSNLYFGGLIPLSLNGQLSGKIQELQLTGALQTEVRHPKGLKSNSIYQITGVTVNIQANNVKVSFAKGMGVDDDLLQSIYADMDNSPLSQWIASTREMIDKYAVHTFISIANNVLASLSVVQINAFLLPEASL